MFSLEGNILIYVLYIFKGVNSYTHFCLNINTSINMYKIMSSKPFSQHIYNLSVNGRILKRTVTAGNRTLFHTWVCCVWVWLADKTHVDSGTCICQHIVLYNCHRPYRFAECTSY